VIVDGWHRHSDSLVSEVTFRDFDEALAFVERVARECVDFGRRPDMCIAELNHVRLTISNPHHAGLTEQERRLMEKVDALIAELAPAARRTT
jgi:pterin-4a-carbinolamine dehydratase